MTGLPQLDTAQWRKSSYSGLHNSDCVEVASNLPRIVPVRDSKDRFGPALVFESVAWSSFVTAVKCGEFPGT